MEPVVLNRRRRFWRWLLGYTQPLYTYEQVREFTDLAAKQAHMAGAEKASDAGAISGARRFHIIDAMNGKIIRFQSGEMGERLGSSRATNGEQYYLVKENESLMEALAKIVVIDKIVP